MRLILVRHGQTTSNVSGALDTAVPGAELTALGLAQARAVPAALADERVTGVYASPLVRTQLTAAPLADALGIEVSVQPGLEEIGAGDLEMRSDQDAVDAYLGCLTGWMLGDLAGRMPGGDDGHAFTRRYDAAILAVVGAHAADDTVVVVSHGAAIRTYTSLRATGPDVASIHERRIMNTGGAFLNGDPETGWALTRWSGEPLGGPELADRSAHDVTGESPEEATTDQ